MIVQENAEDFEEFNCEDVLEEEELFHNVPVPYHLCSMIWTSISTNFTDRYILREGKQRN